MLAATGAYTATAASMSIAVSFAPGWVILLTPHRVFGASPVFQEQYVWRTAAMSSTAVWDQRKCTLDGIVGLTATGFNIGTDFVVNRFDEVYYWLAGTLDDAVCKAGNYIGNGTAKEITGLGFRPCFMLLQEQNSVSNGFGVVVWESAILNGGDFPSESTLGKSQVLATPNFQSDYVTSLTNDGFWVGTNLSVNQNSHAYTYLAFREVSQTTVQGEYHGNGTDNRSITMDDPFLPLAVFAKNVVQSGTTSTMGVRTDNTTGQTTFRQGQAASTIRTVPNSNHLQAFHAGGFEIGTDMDVASASGVNDRYVYFAIKTSPPPQLPPSSGGAPTGPIITIPGPPLIPIVCEDAIASGSIVRSHVRSGQIFEHHQTTFTATASYGTTGTATWTVDVSVSVTTSGGAVLAAGQLSAVSSDGGLYLLSRLVRDSTVLMANSLVRHNSAIRTMTFDYLDTPASGVHTYSIEYSHFAPNSPAGSPYNSRTLNRALTVTEYKR